MAFQFHTFAAFEKHSCSLTLSHSLGAQQKEDWRCSGHDFGQQDEVLLSKPSLAGVCLVSCLCFVNKNDLFTHKKACKTECTLPPPPCPSTGLVQAPPPCFYAIFWEVILVFRCVSHEISRFSKHLNFPGFMRCFRSKPTSNHHPPVFMQSFCGA